MYPYEKITRAFFGSEPGAVHPRLRGRSHLFRRARRAEGLNELEWVPIDAMEEYMLIRAKDLTVSFSHVRLNDLYNDFMTEVIAMGGGDTNGHRKALVEPVIEYTCAAKSGRHWIITISGEGAPALTENGSFVDYEKFNDWAKDIYW
mgnify:CR=1 FL=1